MELRTFVSRALCDIVNGVKDAQQVTDKGTVVPPVSSSLKYKAIETGISALTAIEFEVTVKTDEHAGSEGKLSVVAAIVGGTVKEDSGSTSGHAAKLCFRVPIQFPCS